MKKFLYMGLITLSLLSTPPKSLATKRFPPTCPKAERHLNKINAHALESDLQAFAKRMNTISRLLMRRYGFKGKVVVDASFIIENGRAKQIYLKFHNDKKNKVFIEHFSPFFKRILASFHFSSVKEGCVRVSRSFVFVRGDK